MLKTKVKFIKVVKLPHHEQIAMLPRVAVIICSYIGAMIYCKFSKCSFAVKGASKKIFFPKEVEQKREKNNYLYLEHQNLILMINITMIMIWVVTREKLLTNFQKKLV